MLCKGIQVFFKGLSFSYVKHSLKHPLNYLACKTKHSLHGLSERVLHALPVKRNITQ